MATYACQCVRKCIGNACSSCQPVGMCTGSDPCPVPALRCEAASSFRTSLRFGVHCTHVSNTHDRMAESTDVDTQKLLSTRVARSHSCTAWRVFAAKCRTCSYTAAALLQTSCRSVYFYSELAKPVVLLNLLVIRN